MHSGFLTRKLEQKYHSLIKQSIELFIQLIITYIDRTTIPSFEKQFTKLYTNLQKMDELKSSQPKFSQNLKPLSLYIHQQNTTPKSKSMTQTIINPNPKQRRPMTTTTTTTSSITFFKPHNKTSQLQYQRKTIHFLPDKQKRKLTLEKLHKQQKNRTRHCSFSLRRTTQNGGDNGGKEDEKQIEKFVENEEFMRHLTMEQLMQKNRLIERKMTLFRKKKQIHTKINNIPQLQQQYDSTQFL